MNFKIDNAYLLDVNVLCSKLEFEGPLGKYFNLYDDEKSSFEDREINMLYSCIDMILEKNNLNESDIDLAVGGELSNQLGISSQVFKLLNIPLLNVFAACSTISLALGLTSLLVSDRRVFMGLCYTSSYNQCAEKTFRFPIEYGVCKECTQTFTSSIAAVGIVSNIKTDIKISSFTLGKVIDVGFDNPLDLGRAMVPGALECLYEHFKETDTEPKDYDLILTGDLSKYGYEIVKNELNKNYDNVNNYYDCGLMLYSNNFYAGGSGPGTVGSVLFSYVVDKLKNKKYKKVLICATGALFNTTMVGQKKSIPSISHIVVLESV